MALHNPDDLSTVATAAALADVPTVAEFDARTILTADYATATAVADVPTVAEFNARSILAADYATAAALATIESAVGNIANVGSPSYAAPSSYTLTTGTQTSGTFANVDSDNDVYHVHTDAGNALSLIYDWTLEAGELANSIVWRGRWNGTNDTLLFALYDWVGAAWVTWFTQVGVSGTTAAADFAKETNLVAKYTGTGANVGKVRCRITGSSLSSCTLSTDQLIVGKTTAAGGITNGSTVALAGSNTNKNYIGNNWTLDLGGQDISGSYFYGAKLVTGIASGSTDCTFENCDFGAATVPPGRYINCGFGLATGTLIAASAGQYLLRTCYSVVPGAGTPVFDWATATGTVQINGRGWHGGSSHTIDGDTTISWEVNGGGGQTFDGGGTVELRGVMRAATLTNVASGKTSQIVGVVGPVAINGAGGTVNVYGNTGTITDNSAGVVTINRAQAVNVANVNQEVSANNSRYLAVTATMTESTWNTVGTHEVFTVTGAVRARMWITCGDNVGSAADGASVSFGVAGATTAFIAATAEDTLDTGELWHSNSPAAAYAAFGTAVMDYVINGLDVGYDITVEDLTGGVLTFHCVWEPLSATGAVVAGAGGTL